jgi:oxalate decarboxylase/phosphoglucose isomerase-like protein (cupin superfamily)
MTDTGPYLGTTTYVHLGPNGTALPLPVTPTFWEDLDASVLPQGEGRLVSSYHFPASWDSWEKHPAGEELVLLLSGAMELILDTGAQEARYALTNPGEFVIVPRDTWHTADVPAGATALFITPGDGTENRPRR